MMRWTTTTILAVILGSWSTSGLAAQSKWTTAKTATTERFAIVLGVNDHESSVQQRLKYADDDALAMHQLLLEAGVKSRLLVVLDADTGRLHPSVSPDGAPTLKTLLKTRRIISRQIRNARQRGANTELFFFYSGHGDVYKGEGYVVLSDGRLTRTLLFEEVLKDIKADQTHVVIDACKSYFMVFDKGPGGTRTSYPHPFAKVTLSIDLTHVGLVLSASSEKNSHEWERYQAGVFSHEVRSAFRGGADVDRDGRITYAELGAFLTIANEGIDNERFRPQFLIQPPGTPPGDLDQPILAWHETKNELLVDEPSLGHFYVETAKGVRVLDAHAMLDQRLRLFIPSQRPLFIRRVDEVTEYILETHGVDTLSILPRQPIQIVPKGALHLAFEKLFDTPFGAVHVISFKNRQRDQSQAIPPRSIELKKNRAGKPARIALLSTAGASVALGLGMTLAAAGQYHSGKTAPQRDVGDINQSIRRLNTSAVIFYGLAGAAGITYLVLKLWLRHNTSKVTLAPAVTANSAALSLSGAFP